MGCGVTLSTSIHYVQHCLTEHSHSGALHLTLSCTECKKETESRDEMLEHYKKNHHKAVGLVQYIEFATPSVEYKEKKEAEKKAAEEKKEAERRERERKEAEKKAADEKKEAE